MSTSKKASEPTYAHRGTHCVQQLIRSLKRYINDTPELLSLLYDMDLLPEQVKEGTHDWGRMLMLAEAWKHRKCYGKSHITPNKQGQAQCKKL